jgi:hypothetical protein
MLKYTGGVMKRICLVLSVFSLLLSLNGCSSVPEARNAYEGGDRSPEQLSRFYMAGTGSFTAVLYKVDGKTCSDMNALRHSYNGPWMGFNVRLLPGSHDFELVIIKEKRSENLSFVTTAGSDYELVEEKGLFQVYRKAGEGRSAVDVKRGGIPFYQEPEKTAPHGLLVQNDETMTDGAFALYRIDGRPGTATEALQTSNIFVTLGGAYEIRLTPGKHVIEYSCGKDRIYTRTLSSKEIMIEAGRKYRLRIVDMAVNEKGLVQSRVELASF